MTIKDFNKQEYEETHGITKFRNMLRQVQQPRKQIRRDSLPSEYYLQIRNCPFYSDGCGIIFLNYDNDSLS